MPTALQLLVTSGSPGGELACPQRSSISHLERLLFSQKHTHLPALLAMPAEFTAAPSCGKSWVGASKRDPHKGSNSSDTTWLLASTAQVNIPAGDWQRLHSHELRRKHTKAEGQAGPRDGRDCQCRQRQTVLFLGPKEETCKLLATQLPVPQEITTTYTYKRLSFSVQTVSVYCQHHAVRSFLSARRSLDPICSVQVLNKTSPCFAVVYSSSTAAAMEAHAARGQA